MDANDRENKTYNPGNGVYNPSAVVGQNGVIYAGTSDPNAAGVRSDNPTNGGAGGYGGTGGYGNANGAGGAGFTRNGDSGAQYGGAGGYGNAAGAVNGQYAGYNNGGYSNNYGSGYNNVGYNNNAGNGTTSGKKGRKKWIALAVCACLILSAACGFGGALLAGETFGEANVISSDKTVYATNYNIEKATGSQLTIQEIVAANENAVVEIRTELVATDIWMFQYVTQGAGSGVIISDDGYIMTNNHVIEGATKITVTLHSGDAFEATLVGADEDEDIAVIKIDAKGLTKVKFGDSSKLSVGELAVAIGNPLGQLGGTATAGIISALDRELTVEGHTMRLLQTDASINPGNSGGGLFNGRGELIGVVNAKSSGSDVEGLGFAIPVNTAANVAQQLIEKGYVSGKADIGMTFLDLTSPRDAMMYGVQSTGVYVKSVDNKEAEKAGFRSGDMIYMVEDTPITSLTVLNNVLADYAVGDSVEITVIRSGEAQKLTLVIGEKHR